MKFVSIRVITDDPKRLVAFYEQVTGGKAHWFTEDFAELVTPTATLAIGHRRTMEQFAPGAARSADNHSVILEFLSPDVDADYARLTPALGAVLQTPTTMPWGNRSLLFRDPDGNLVNLFTPVTEHAKARFANR